MIVLRIDTRGSSSDVRWMGSSAALGSGTAADIRHDFAGWAAREAVLIHLGHEVLVVRADGAGQWRLRVGDSLRLGEATLTLVGLLPLAEEDDEPRMVAPPPGASNASDGGECDGEPAPADEGSTSVAAASAASPASPAGTGSGGGGATAAAPAPFVLEPLPPHADAPRMRGPNIESPRAPTPTSPPTAGKAGARASKPQTAPVTAGGSKIASSPVDEGAAATAAATTSTGVTTTAPATNATSGREATGAADATATTASAEPPVHSRFASTSFDEEMLALLRRSPWWILSVAIHAVILVGLTLLVPEREAPPREHVVYGMVGAAETLPDPIESGGPEDRADVERDPEPVTSPDPTDGLPDTTHDLPTEALPPRPGGDPPAPESPTEIVDEPQAPVLVIGPSGGATALRISTKSVPTKAPTAVSTDLSRVNEDADRALEVNRKAAAKVRDEITRGGGALGRVLRGLRTEDILVVRGTFDHMETVLEELSIPFTLKAPYDLAEDADLSRHKVIFWNCGENVLAARHQHLVVDAIREFVKAGGYLFTTDWAVSTLLIPAFPGMVATEGRIKPLPEMIVHIAPTASGKNDRLLDGVFEADSSPRWWLEAASFDVRVLAHENVEVLVEAPELEKPPFNRSPAIAVTFSYGRGRVLHVMGHYYQQKGNVAGTAGIQRLPLNFVKMRFE